MATDGKVIKIHPWTHGVAWAGYLRSVSLLDAFLNWTKCGLALFGEAVSYAMHPFPCIVLLTYYTVGWSLKKQAHAKNLATHEQYNENGSPSTRISHAEGESLTKAGSAVLLVPSGSSSLYGGVSSHERPRF